MATPRKTPNKAPATGKRPAAAAGSRRKSRTAKAPARSGIGRTGIAALALTGLTALGALAFGLLRGRAGQAASDAGTTPTDLLQDQHPDGSERAIDAFRPDPTAPVPAAERDALRPAPAGSAAPTLVAGQADELRRVDAAPS